MQWLVRDYDTDDEIVGTEGLVVGVKTTIYALYDVRRVAFEIRDGEPFGVLLVKEVHRYPSRGAPLTPPASAS